MSAPPVPTPPPSAACAPLDGASMLGPFRQYRADLAPCTPGQVGRPLFFGRSSAKDEPLFVAMDFEQYQIARVGMAVATTAAVALGVALAFVLIKKRKGSSTFY